MLPLPNATVFFDDALEDDDDKQVNSGIAVTEGTSALLEKESLTKQERLAVECLKPRLQVKNVFSNNSSFSKNNIS